MTRALVIAFTLLVATIVSCGGKDKDKESGGGDTTGDTGKKDPKKDGSGSGSAVAETGSGSGSGDGAGSGSGDGSGGEGEKVAEAPKFPTEVDFEDDSITKITEKSLMTDFAALEKEIGDGEVKKDDGKEEPKKEEPKKEEPKKE